MALVKTLFLEERRQKILELLKQKRKITITELSGIFDVGEVTLRKDLNALEEQGIVTRTHGGAMLAGSLSEEITLQVRESRNRKEKERIAVFASQLVGNGETVVIDGGSTTLFAAAELKKRTDLTVITNSPDIADVLVGTNRNKVLLTGGELQPKTNIMVGPITQTMLDQFRADKAILGMSSLVPDEGFFTVNYFEAEIKRLMMKYAREVIIVMDSSKFGNCNLSLVAPLSMADKIITDDGVPVQLLDVIKKHKIEVITV